MSDKNSQNNIDKTGDSLRLKLLEFSESKDLQNHLAEAYYIWQNDPDFIGDFVGEDDIDDPTFSKFYDWFLYDYKVFETEERLIERFLKKFNKELTNTEINVLKTWTESTCSFFEVKKIIDDKRCLIINIFKNQEIIITDSNLAKNINPADIIYARPLKTGDNYYFSDLISLYPRVFKPTILNIFNSEYEEYKNTFGKKSTINSYLKDWGYLISNYIEDIIKHPQYITSEGEEFTIATTKYRIIDKSTAIELLKEIESINEIKTDSKKINFFSWEILDGINIGANIEINNKTLSLVCNSENNLKLCKKKIEETLGDSVEHAEDKTRKLDSYIDSYKDKKINKMKLPTGAKTKKELNQALEEYYSDWIDKPLSQLDGKTPRESLKTKSGIEQLEKVLKELENLYENARKVGEPYFEVNSLRDRLKEISSKN